MFKLTFYKGYPFAYGGNDGGRVTVPALLSQSDWAAFLAQFEHFSPPEYDGVFFDEQKEIYIEPFTAIDTCNYLKVDIDDGADVKYFFIDDVVRIPCINGATNDAARVTIFPDIFLTDFFQPSPTGGYKLPNVSGIILQSTHKYDDLIAMPPVQPYYRQPTIVPHIVYNSASTWVIVCTLSAPNGLILTVAFDISSSPANIPIWSLIASGTVSIKLVPVSGDSAPISLNVQILNMYAIPRAWVNDIVTDTYILGGEYSEEMRLLIVDSNNNERAGLFFSSLKISQKAGQIIADTLAAPNWAGRKVSLKTATQEIELTGLASGKVSVPILLNVSPTGSDGITITACVNSTIVDISSDFACDFAINASALDMAQHKTANVLQTMTAVIGGIGGVVGGVMSGNYFGAIQSAAGATESIINQYEGLNAPATVTNAGYAANAILSFGGICFYEYAGAMNESTAINESQIHGFLYRDDNISRGANISYELPKQANEHCYYCIKNAKILGDFGNSVAAELSKLFARGVSFTYINVPGSKQKK